MPAIDEYSVVTVPIQLFFGQTGLGTATAFTWKKDENYFLITNWHNVSGKDPLTDQHISKTAAEPDRLLVWWNKKNEVGNKFSFEHRLRDNDGVPLWQIHPRLKKQVDVVALPIDLPKDAEAYPINEMPRKNLKLQIGMDVFILGYPFGIGAGGLPIWKRGSIASEPELFDQDRPNILIDSASRPGMSGSPVIRRSWSTHTLDNNNVEMGAGYATRFVGVYSGRLYTSDPNDPQLGLTWPAHLVDEIIVGGQIDAQS